MRPIQGLLGDKPNLQSVYPVTLAGLHHRQESTMIGYTCVGTNDLKRASGFYDALFAELGAKRAMETPDKMVAWSAGNGAMFIVTRPADGKQATIGNGVMIALAAGSKDKVN